MQITQGNTLQALRGIQAFLDAHADVLGAVVTSGARRKLDAQVVALDAHVKAQGGNELAARDATQAQYAARDVLLQEHMAPIARIAAVELPRSPETQPLRMPGGRLSTELLYGAAVAMADEAERHAEVFIAALLPEDFVARLRAAAAAVRVPLDERAQRRVLRKGATASLEDDVKSAMLTVKILDAGVRVALKNETGLLVAWNAVRRPQTKTGKSSGSVAGGTAVNPAAPSVPIVPTAAVAPAALALVSAQG